MAFGAKNKRIPLMTMSFCMKSFIRTTVLTFMVCMSISGPNCPGCFQSHVLATVQDGTPNFHRAGFAALGRSRLNSRKHNWTAPVVLTAVQPSPWLYRESTAPLGKNAETEQSEKGPPIQPKKEPQDSPHQTTNEFTGEKRRGGDGDKNAPLRTNP